ncbi:bifunctional DNA-formamidopyrimidine glycosylase/DNA-(apurinic or apyrimidinic site) lyase [Kingella negevensis]|uniref:Formamidopyrimidine-DNA glycosylase n=1 Tax=Kingella negevensis TaxID=1522312 RepID=A0A238HF39_9NEIS|nr:bifunctional DNA-formamidopyrimidine glycosylase/DNA-(apurinic or apyrimidinic site) lyase [Kingella negevensis]MDK4681080.1 bifunctional DNA-formamidopyrimidine glycosylase/DNA-(apurinic or apyrimidinic site) lyase [Kingella negevensis]MDK4683282.1 bifunctional DNA-formamidopyrimidine glycosylase/DNA-(apurinic or apyrimidinic site) lyase [Kingella negevensis]MDK4684288.1 bifunctional DNA-formamidopyrimidine glycosylase/DNA-(apurinic or apyrimidinic site) lyase [Kingella negevensis]MDK469158
MPELPEVETTLRGIAPHINGKKVAQTIVRQPKLRWQIPADLAETLHNQTVRECRRRAKYLLIQFDTGVLIIHLGMSGSLRIFRDTQPEVGKHDHADFIFEDGTLLRYHDPRRFGAILWLAGVAEHHELLRNLGVEPLSDEFTAEYLFSKLQGKNRAIKLMIMDNAVVVGVGNIYANESLFQAAILPNRPAKLVSKEECADLVVAIKQILQRSIETGGSTLRDFVDSDGKSGYFQQEYKVYGRDGESCLKCGGLIEKSVLGQRGTFYCANCQQ